MKSVRDPICYKCAIPLNEDNWMSMLYRKKHYKCRSCVNEDRRSDQNFKEWGKKDRLKKRIDVINNYGGKCECCGENDIYYLTIDHINNDGYMDKHHGYHLYNRLIKEGYPKDNYRLLCYNCNFSRYVYGACGHIYNPNLDIKPTSIVGQNRQAYKNKTCRCCYKSLVEGDNWSRCHVVKYDLICKECSHKNQNAYRIKHVQKLKNILYDHYGTICVFCGQDNKCFLTFDHANNDGYIQRKEHKTDASMYRWLIKNDFPDDFQILCYNCNCAKGFHGYVKINGIVVQNKNLIVGEV